MQACFLDLLHLHTFTKVMWTFFNTFHAFKTSSWLILKVDISWHLPFPSLSIVSDLVPDFEFFVRFQDLARSNLPDEVRISLADEVLGPPKPHQLRTVNDISKIHIFQPFLHIDRDLIIWSYFHIFPPFNVITSCFNMFPPLVSCILMHFVLLEGRTAFFSPKKTQGSQGFFWCWFGRRLMEAQALSQDHGSTATHGLNFHIFSRLYWDCWKNRSFRLNRAFNQSFHISIVGLCFFSHSSNNPVICSTYFNNHNHIQSLIYSSHSTALRALHI